ncbi:MAG: cysteine desulfurase family protein [Flavobacteriaceae bacterium]
MNPIYFDNAATTPILPEVVARMQKVLSAQFGNPSSVHGTGREAKAIVETARKTIAKELNVKPAEIIFTSGGTEGDNMILTSAVQSLGVKTIITSPIEHHAVLHAVEHLQQTFGVQVWYVGIKPSGEIDYDDLVRLLQQDDSKKLVSLMHINNELGTFIDLHRVANLCKDNNALFHSDTVQSVGHYRLDLSEIPIDFLVAAAHKFHGPKGVGFVFVRKSSGLAPMIHGGAQERGLRAGTESVHNIAGMEEAFMQAYKNMDEDQAYISDLKSYALKALQKAFPDAHFNGCCADLNQSTYTIINVRLPIPEDKATLLGFSLDLQGIACSKGSACQSGSESGSHVLEHILDEEQQAMPSVRISFSKLNTQKEVDRLVEVLLEYANS